MYRYGVTIVRPEVLEVDDEWINTLRAVNSLKQRLTAQTSFLQIDANIRQNMFECMESQFGLHKVCSIETVKTISPHDADLRLKNFIIGHVFSIIFEEFIHGSEPKDEVVGILKLMVFARLMKIKIFVPYRFQRLRFDEFLKIQS